MANHIHMLLLVQDPGAVPHFLQYIKRESAHAINQILGRKKRTVWCDGSDDPVVLDPETALKRLTYIYLNPARAHLEVSIDQYPHLHSWQAFSEGRVQEEEVYRIPRDKIAMFYEQAQKHSLKRALKYVRKGAQCQSARYRVEPFGWTECFAETRGKDPSPLRAEVIAAVRQEERRLKTERARPVIGADRLMQQPMNKAHAPSTRGRRMVCRGGSKDIRCRYLMWYDEARTLAKEALRSLKHGIVTNLPPGFFCPGGFLLSNVLPATSPLAFA
jgi:REP element-mobilizing transposase RayT